MEKKARDTSPADQQHEAETLLTTQQAVWLLRISCKTLERMRVEGCGPRFVKIGRCVRYRQRDPLTWNHQHPPINIGVLNAFKLCIPA